MKKASQPIEMKWLFYSLLNRHTRLTFVESDMFGRCIYIVILFSFCQVQYAITAAL